MDDGKLHRELGEIASQLGYVSAAIKEAADHRQETTDRIARIETRLDSFGDAAQIIRRNEVEISRVNARENQHDEDRAETRARYALAISLIALATSVITAITPHMTN